MPDDDDQQGARAGPRFRLAVPVFNGARENVKVVSYLTKAQLWVTASGTPDAEAASALIFARVYYSSTSSYLSPIGVVMTFVHFLSWLDFHLLFDCTLI